MFWDERDAVQGALMARHAVEEAALHLRAADPRDWRDGGVDNYLAAREQAIAVTEAVGEEIDGVARLAERFAREAAGWDGLRLMAG